MELETLIAEQTRLVLRGFDEAAALALGQWLVTEGLTRALPIAIDIRTLDRTLFHASLPGASPNNDNWARRKGNTALRFGQASMRVTLEARAKGRTDLTVHGLDPTDYALSGGGVPIRVTGTGVVGVATVSGLPEAEDHALVVRGIETLMA
jgi:uncharacterized protein (UPF0303 family)